MHWKDFVSLRDFQPGDLRNFLHVACMVKATPSAYSQSLKGKTLAMLFEKPSLRTRVTFDLAIEELGGHPIYLRPPRLAWANASPCMMSPRIWSAWWMAS